MDKYTVPDGVDIGHVHLKVSDLTRSLEFYCELLGFELISSMGADAAFISAGGYHHHIGLNTWQSKGAAPAPANHPGLFHVAIRYPTRIALAHIFQRVLESTYDLTGAADHGVSEALYLNDPDQNGLELYWDRPRDAWPKDSQGKIMMYTRKLDAEGLLNELKK